MGRLRNIVTHDYVLSRRQRSQSWVEKHQDRVEELERFQTSGTNLLDLLIVLVGVVLLFDAELIWVHHNEKVISEVLFAYNVQELEQILAISSFNVKVQRVISLLSILLILVKVLEQVLWLVAWLELLGNNEQNRKQILLVELIWWISRQFDNLVHYLGIVVHEELECLLGLN